MVDTCSTRAGAMAVQSAVLPFVIPWQELDSAFEVLSLNDAALRQQPQDGAHQPANTQNMEGTQNAAQGWEELLEALEIPFRRLDQSITDPLPEPATVISAFDLLDQLPTAELDQWYVRVSTALRPGGLLIMGGTYRHAEQTGQIQRKLQQAGFARSRVILKPTDATQGALAAALDITGQKYAIIAQTPASGKVFDVFSPAFLAVPVSALSARLETFERAFHAHLNHEMQILHDRITHLDTHVNSRLDRLEAMHRQLRQDSAAQRQEIASLQDTVARLERLTRRRGLRKLVHRIKQKRRGTNNVASDTPASAPVTRPPAASEASHDMPAAPPPPAPLSLSCAEADVYTRLFESMQSRENG